MPVGQTQAPLSSGVSNLLQVVQEQGHRESARGSDADLVMATMAGITLSSLHRSRKRRMPSDFKENSW